MSKCLYLNILQILGSGFIAAIIATCCGSFQRIYIKLNILPATPETDLWSSLRTTVLGHFELAICATIGIFPLAFVEEILYGNILYIPLTKIIFGATLQWVASLCAWQGLAVLEPLSQNIAKIVQRICSIIVTIYLFDKKVSALNRNGMILAFFGVALYSYVQQKKKKLPPDTVANNDKLRGLELGLSKTKKLDTSI